ncbi:hypothetical protein BN2476_300191 [Paraburkholderia piptadeniae]|uniref:Uncharacterized protein n=1 Tax=Paraburkholderia piptadeniae TaxID=1701573 RepID=A0A1N7S327_9BURK|nr:hypothetical protein BN2476_300191 [Paraburkholderia piptadeniae]
MKADEGLAYRQGCARRAMFGLDRMRKSATHRPPLTACKCAALRDASQGDLSKLREHPSFESWRTYFEWLMFSNWWQGG